MARGPCAFKQRDLMRALRATQAAGIEIARVEINKDGKIVLVTGKQQEGTPGGGKDENEWDGITWHRSI